MTQDSVKDKLEKYIDELSEQQIRAIPLLAFGMKPSKVAKTINVSDTTIRQWMRTDQNFRQAMSEFIDNSRYYHVSMLNQAAVRAWDRMFEYLDTDYPEEDRVGRTNQASAAKFVLSELGIMRQEPEREEADPQLNITEDSADIIARKVFELQNKDNPSGVETEYTVVDSLDDNDPRISYNNMNKARDVGNVGDEFGLADKKPEFPKHPGTEYGEITYNDDESRARCHICGNWEIDLVMHIRNEHKLSPARYRRMYMIPESIKLGLFKPVVAKQADVDDYNKHLESTELDEVSVQEKKKNKN